MNELCFMSHLTSAEWAAWVQAIFSVIAIVAAAGIALYQSRAQHRSALKLHTVEQASAKADTAKTLAVLVRNASKMMTFVAKQLHDRESVHKAAEGLVHTGIGQIGRIDSYLAGIPLHSMPYSLVTLTMITGATVRDFKEKVEMVLRLHRQMDARMFEDFFMSVAAMTASIEATCSDIETEVKRLEAAA